MNKFTKYNVTSWAIAFMMLIVAFGGVGCDTVSARLTCPVVAINDQVVDSSTGINVGRPVEPMNVDSYLPHPFTVTCQIPLPDQNLKLVRTFEIPHTVLAEHNGKTSLPLDLTIDKGERPPMVTYHLGKTLLYSGSVDQIVADRLSELIIMAIRKHVTS